MNPRTLTRTGLIAFLALAGCGGPATDSVPRIDPPSLIARVELFGNPEKTQARISPDATQLSYLAPVEGVLNVWVGPIDDPGAARAVTGDTGRGIRQYMWAYTNRHILYLQDKGGDENWRLYSTDVESGETEDLTPLEGVRATIYATSHKYPDEILIGLNDRDPRFHDVYRLDYTNGRKSCIEVNKGYAQYNIDHDYNVRFAMKMTPDGGSQLDKKDGEGDWQQFLRIGMEDMMTTAMVAFDKTGRIAYFIDSRGRNTAALVALDLESGKEEIVFEDPRADVSDAIVHPTEHTIQAVATNYERQEWTVLDDAIQPDLDYLETVADGELQIVDRSLDDRHWIVVYVLSDAPVAYYHYDRDQQAARRLFTSQPALEDETLAPMRPQVIASRDGLDLVSYLTLPVESDPDQDGRPGEPGPMVLLVHGGPWARDSWGYNPYHQWLANRGYAVLSVNYRGSTGFGKDFINASNKQWAAKMHDDLIDAADWAIREGIAEAEKIAIMGGSYGGYATLVGVTFTPDRFACGVDIVGPSNLITLIESFPAYWQPTIELWASRVGDHRTEEGRALLTERSPLTRAEEIRVPLLIGQGANDPRVTQIESDQIVQAMQARDIPVTYVLYPDEGHGFARPENRQSFHAVAEAFLGECLGGRTEPIGDSIVGSSIEVPAGADHVPGLSDSLASKEAAGDRPTS